MASLHQQPGSPFWYLAYRDANGQRLKKSTGLRTDDPNDTLAARTLRSEAETEELKRDSNRSAAKDESAWDRWVPGFLVRHCPNPKTRERYQGTWKWIALWLEHRSIRTPREISYRSALDWMAWRTSFTKRTGKQVSKNTAINDLKVLALAMREAVRLEFIAANPFAQLGIKKDAAKRKPTLTDADIAFLREHLQGEPEWMQTAFHISLHTGCRLAETAIPLEGVDLRAGGGVGKITFPKPKGGEGRAFTIPMPPELRPMFERMKTERRKVTLTLPFQPSRRWQQFLIKIDRREHVFHCLRVTYVNRLREAGVPREAAKRLVNHASDLVHQIYQRETFEDLLPYAGAVKFPIADAGK